MPRASDRARRHWIDRSARSGRRRRRSQARRSRRPRRRGREWTSWATSTGSADPVPVVSSGSGGARPRRRGQAPGSGRPRATTERRVRASGRRSCETSSGDGRLRFGRQGVAEPARGVVQSRSGRARGDLEHLGDLHERQPEVVVQDEDRPLVDREPAERPLQFVAVGDGGVSSGVVGPSMGRTRTLAVQ